LSGGGGGGRAGMMACNGRGVVAISGSGLAATTMTVSYVELGFWGLR
jgi:hypothetical protein